LTLGAVVLREFPPASRAVVPSEPAVRPPPRDAPAGVPPRAVSVPMLLLPDGRQIRIGDTETAIDASLGRGARVGLDAVEREGRRERVTRFYNHAGTPFVLVYEAFTAPVP